MRCMTLVALALGAAVPAVAQETPPKKSFEWKVNEQSAQADRSRASRAGFGVQMFVTDDYEGFLKAWAGPTPPQISVTDRIERGKPVNAMIIFGGCQAASDGNCNLTAVYSIVGPDGTAYGEPYTGRVWGGSPAPDYNLQLAEGSLGLVVETDEPLGRYTFKASITDNVAGVTLDVEAPVEAIL